MQYPPGFPDAQQNEVETARDMAELDLRKAISTENANRLDCSYHFIIAVFREFARQANKAVSDGIWTGVQRRFIIDSFLASELIPHAHELADIGSFQLFSPSLPLEKFRGVKPIPS